KSLTPKPFAFPLPESGREASRDHLGNGAAQGSRQLRAGAEAHDEVGAALPEAEEGHELATQARHLDQLVDERLSDPECRRLQGKPLAGAAGLDPMRLVARLGDEHGDAGRAGDVAAVLSALAARRE